MGSSKKRSHNRVFVDSSVLFAAALSPSGGSFRLLREARERNMELFVTPYVIVEVGEGLRSRYPQALEIFHSFLIHFPIRLMKNPSLLKVNQCAKILPQEDAPILAGAIAAQATQLVTLDRKHFLIPLKKQKLTVEILTPGDFIKKYFV